MNIHELQKTDQFSKKVSESFANQKYELISESHETTWGFTSTSGKTFKISNADMVSAFSDILTHWEAWTDAKLNVNSVNPDDTIYTFSKRYFGEGAYKDLAEVQRRGFAHLINALAYSALNDGAYGEPEWQRPLAREDYVAALSILQNNSANAQNLASPAASAALPKIAGSSSRLSGGENILFYGAPGTGKSHDIWQKIDKKTDPHFVTVFHPDMQNSDFTGTLKPGISKKGDVTYAFRPGPFARAVASAWANPANKVYLVIEELNRAVAAAVFGELFQLLDRNPDGSSTYHVDFPSPEFAEWFGSEVATGSERLSLPSNFWILATMNSADQGVYPLDTAFRRRWRQKYLAIDYNKAPVADVEYALEKGSGKTEWRSFVQVLNDFLVTELSIKEDRLIGPRYLAENDLEGGKLPGKLLIYLWDDLLRHHPDNPLFDSRIKTYGDLDRKISGNKKVFSEHFLAALEDASANSDKQAEASADSPQ